MKILARDSPYMIPVQKGIVGIFDILGYENFLENNAVGEALGIVLDKFHEMPQSARSSVEKLGKEFRWNDILDNTKSIVMSDTIFMSSAYGSPPEGRRWQIWLVFLLQAAALQRKMFEFGLPIRGAISFGDYILKDSSFAGRPIIDAYRMGSQIEAAAIALTDEAAKEMESATADEGIPACFPVVEYLVPLKGCSPRRLHTLNFMLVGGTQSLKGDARQLVCECFWKHRKDIPPGAYDKLANTEMLLRFLQALWVKMYGP